MNTPLGTISFHRLPPGLFFGYEIEADGSKIASAEKALFDTLYLAAARSRLFALAGAGNPTAVPLAATARVRRAREVLRDAACTSSGASRNSRGRWARGPPKTADLRGAGARSERAHSDAGAEGRGNPVESPLGNGPKGLYLPQLDSATLVRHRRHYR